MKKFLITRYARDLVCGRPCKFKLASRYSEHHCVPCAFAVKKWGLLPLVVNPIRVTLQLRKPLHLRWIIAFFVAEREGLPP